MCLLWTTEEVRWTVCNGKQILRWLLLLAEQLRPQFSRCYPSLFLDLQEVSKISMHTLKNLSFHKKACICLIPQQHQCRWFITGLSFNLTLNYLKTTGVPQKLTVSLTKWIISAGPPLKSCPPAPWGQTSDHHWHIPLLQGPRFSAEL